MRRLLILLTCLCLARASWGAIAATTVWEFNAGATASMANGGGFNPANAASMTDLAGANADTASPDVSSATYTFVAADVGNWVYISAGTNWTPGYYQIDCVGTGCDPDLTAGHAQLKAAVGEPNVIDANGNWTTTTVAGCATTASPTEGAFKIDYSRATAAQDTGTDLASADGDAAPCIVTSASHNFVANDVGNLIHVTAGTGWTAGWYEVVSVATNAATLDRACGTDGAKTNGTWYLGGALSWNASLEDAWGEQIIGGNVSWWKAGTYATGAGINIGQSSCANTAACVFEGYAARRGDMPTGTARPVITNGAMLWNTGQYWILRNFRFALTANPITLMEGARGRNLFARQSSTTATNQAFSIYGAASACVGCEAVAQNGPAITLAGQGAACIGCYVHDSLWGFELSSHATVVAQSIAAHNRTGAIRITGGTPAGTIIGSTFYGIAAQRGIGISFEGGVGHTVLNSILSGFTTGLSSAAARRPFLSANDYYNNGTDVSNVRKEPEALSLDPQFTDASEITVSGATSANNSILTCAGCDFSAVTDNVDYFHLTSAGTNGVVGGYLITAHDTTTLTLSADCDTGGNGSNIGGFVTTGHTFAVGALLRAQGFPGPYGPDTTSYVDTGAVQRQEQDTPTPAPTPTWWPATPSPIPTCG